MPQFPPFSREGAPGVTHAAPGQSQGHSQPVPQGRATPSLGSTRADGSFPALCSPWGSPAAGLPLCREVGDRHSAIHLITIVLEQVHCF